MRASASNVSDTLLRILVDINSRYLLIYQSSADAAGWRNVQIRSRRGGIEIVGARKGYFAER